MRPAQDSLVILLAGGTKRRQQHDIATAQARWGLQKATKEGKVRWR
jgi:hypothetical protein